MSNSDYKYNFAGNANKPVFNIFEPYKVILGAHQFLILSNLKKKTQNITVTETQCISSTRCLHQIKEKR